MIRQFAALLLGTAILVAGSGLFNILLPVRAEIEGFSTLEIGALGAVYFAGFIVGCMIVPHFIRRVGHIRTFAVLSGAGAATVLALVFLIDPFAWGALRFVIGFAISGLYTVIESWLNDRARAADRGTIMSVYTIVGLGMLMVGQFLLTLHEPSGFEPFAFVAMLFALALVPVSLTTARNPRRPATVSLDIPGLWRLSPVGFAGCLSVGLVNGSFWSLGPVFARRSGLDVDGVVYFIAGATLAGALAQWPLGRLSDRLDRRRVIAAAAVCAAASGALLGVWQDASTAALIALSFVFGGCAMPLYGLSIAHANDLVDKTGFVAAAGGLLLLYGIGASLGPVVASGLMAYMGGGGLFLFTTIVHAGLAVFAILRLVLRPRPVAEDRAGFVSVPRTSPTLYELDPRSEPLTEDERR
ncbi:MAG: MFS transporter [Defluviicoccus sp.]|nr:MFS transporter [Defluviicoccus sp.]